MEPDALLRAVDARTSRRTYEPVALRDSDADKLRAALAVYHAGLDPARIEVVVGDGAAYNGFRCSYGLFRGVINFLVLIANDADQNSAEKLGYYGDLMLLVATDLGLGSCFVGGTFDKTKVPVELAPAERIIATISLGYVSDEPRRKERMIRGLLHRRSKTIEQMSRTDEKPPSWFTAGMEAVRKAPSAVNRQPVTVDYRNGMVTASVDSSNDLSLLMDLGCAKAHFAVGAQRGEVGPEAAWEWGNGGRYLHNG